MKNKKSATRLKDGVKATVAAGDDVFLQKDATEKEKATGDYTRVTTLSFDEVDPS
jgi:hypothetical protein